MQQQKKKKTKNMGMFNPTQKTVPKIIPKIEVI